MQFNELLILLNTYTAHQHQLDIETSFIQYRLLLAPEPIENLYFMTQKGVAQLED